MRPAVLAAAALLLFTGRAMAQEKARADAIRPRAAEIYGKNDAEAPRKLRIEALFGVYLVDPPRRHVSERVSLDGRRVRVDYWQPSAAGTDAELWARAVQFFVFGRTQWSTGARGVFSEMTGVGEVELVFHDVVRLEKKGRRVGEERVVPYLLLRLTRARFEALDLKLLGRCVERKQCEGVVGRMFDEARLDRKGLKVRG